MTGAPDPLPRPGAVVPAARRAVEQAISDRRGPSDGAVPGPRHQAAVGSWTAGGHGPAQPADEPTDEPAAPSAGGRRRHPRRGSEPAGSTERAGIDPTGPPDGRDQPDGQPEVVGRNGHPPRRPVHLVRRTIAHAWNDRVLGLSAEAAFWQLLSMPPLFLALLGSLGYLSGLLGPDTVDAVERHLLDGVSRAFTPTVVEQVIQPSVSQVLREGRADVISIGFVISLWAGSSATSTFVNTVTIAYGMRDLRGAVHSRLLALWLYLGSVVVGVVLLPLLVLGPSVLIDILPAEIRSDAARLISEAYWPVVGGILLTGLATFYHLALPQRLPWHRGVPGALLAMCVFLLGSSALRGYISFVVSQGFTYGTLAAPIAALLFFFLLALAVLLGAELNATIEHLWPSRRRESRRPDGS